MITIKEIAKQLNMSTTTVSNVIHGKTGEVSDDTLKKVQDFLAKVDYVPNINARNLAQNESKIIGLALKARADKYDNLIMDPFVSELIGGVEETIRNAGYFMMLYISSDTVEIMRHVSTWNVDGLILFGMLDDDGIRVSEKYKKPIVCIDTYSIEGLKHFTNVGLNDEQGSYDITNYLIKMGHKKIAFLSDKKNEEDLARLNGYKMALSDAKIPFRQSNFIKIRPREEEIQESLREICEKVKDFTAIVCVSDLYAVTLLAALSDRGINVPDDISIVGFDDNMLGKLHRPALTTVHQDIKTKGITAASTLLKQLAGEKTPNQIQLPTHLVIRDTVKDLRTASE